MDAFNQNKLGRGVNILGYDPIWSDQSKARMREKHFKLIGEAGFNNVRIALHPFRDRAMERGNELSEKWLETLKWAVEQALNNGLMAILDFHEFIVMSKDPVSKKESFLAFWGQVGRLFSNYSDKVLFEILNEPNGELTPELWNRFLTEALSIIRKTNPERTVVIGPAYWNTINQLEALRLPEDDENIIATIHYYEPMDFTHQGAKWAGREDKLGVVWRGTDEEKQAITRGFDLAQAWSKKHNRPLFLGEFGVYDKADMESRTRYLSFITRKAEENGWSWAYWQFDSDFILYDIDNDKWVEPVLKALVP